MYIYYDIVLYLVCKQSVVTMKAVILKGRELDKVYSLIQVNLNIGEFLNFGYFCLL